MQIATLSYQYKPKENLNGDSRAKLCHRHIRTTLTNLEKKSKQRQSLYSDLTLHNHGQLPPITTTVGRGSSMRVKGSSLPSSKLGDTSTQSFHNRLSRSNSRLSINSDHHDARSRSMSPAGIIRPSSKLVRMKFGHPIKLRSPDFYGPDKSETELHLLEDSFVNDSIRSAHQTGRSSIIPPYEPLDDPHLRRFFQSPFVLDIVRKTLSVDPQSSYKPERKLSKMSNLSKRSKSNGAYDHHNDDYLRIVTKSSGYAKLNGYDCVPKHSPARQYYGRSNGIDPTMSESRFNHPPPTREKIRRSTSSSMTSFPPHEKRSHRYEKTKQLKPLATSSAIRSNASEHKTDYTIPSIISQV